MSTPGRNQKTVNDEGRTKTEDAMGMQLNPQSPFQGAAVESGLMNSAGGITLTRSHYTAIEGLVDGCSDTGIGGKDEAADMELEAWEDGGMVPELACPTHTSADLGTDEWFRKPSMGGSSEISTLGSPIKAHTLLPSTTGRRKAEEAEDMTAGDSGSDLIMDDVPPQTSEDGDSEDWTSVLKRIRSGNSGLELLMDDMELDQAMNGTTTMPNLLMDIDLIGPPLVNSQSLYSTPQRQSTLPAVPYLEPSTPNMPAHLLHRTRNETPPMRLPEVTPRIVFKRPNLPVANRTIPNPFQHSNVSAEIIDFGNPLHTEDEDIAKVLRQLELSKRKGIAHKTLRYLDPQLTVAVANARVPDLDDAQLMPDNLQPGDVDYMGDSPITFDRLNLHSTEYLGVQSVFSAEKSVNLQTPVLNSTSRSRIDHDSPLAKKGKPTEEIMIEKTVTDETMNWDNDPLSPPRFPEPESTSARFYRKHPAGEYLKTQREIIQSTVKYHEAVLQKERLEYRLQKLEVKIGQVNERTALNDHTNLVVERMSVWNEKTLAGETEHFVSDEEMRDGTEEEWGERLVPLLDSVFYEKMVLKAKRENEEDARRGVEKRKREEERLVRKGMDRELAKRKEFSARSKRMEEEWKIRCERGDWEDEDEVMGEGVGTGGYKKRFKRGRGMEGGKDVKRMRMSTGSKIVVLKLRQ